MEKDRLKGILVNELDLEDVYGEVISSNVLENGKKYSKNEEEGVVDYIYHSDELEMVDGITKESLHKHMLFIKNMIMGCLVDGCNEGFTLVDDLYYKKLLTNDDYVVIRKSINVSDLFDIDIDVNVPVNSGCSYNDLSCMGNYYDVIISCKNTHKQNVMALMGMDSSTDRYDDYID